MIPIGDENPTHRIPIVSYLLLALNIAVFAYELSLSDSQLERFIEAWGIRSTDVMAVLGGDLSLLFPVLLQSLVAMFIHGGWLHIGGNMLFLWVFGDNVEDNFGSLPFLLFYLVSGFGAVIIQALLTPLSPVPAIGASGAISGVLSAYLLLYPRASIRALLPLFIIFTIIHVPAWLMIIIWFGTQLLNGLASLTDAAMMTGGIAYGAHVGGFVVGFILALVFRKPQRPPRYALYGPNYERYYRR